MSDLTSKVKRIPVSSASATQPQKGSRPTTARTWRQTARGQAALVIALSALVLIAIVGLAIDGGSTYERRRTAQNSADSASLASTRIMLKHYDQMIIDYQYDVDGTPDQETEIKNAVEAYAAQHGVQAADLDAHFVNDEKQLVSVVGGTNGCGSSGSPPCRVGENGNVPWTQGAKGIIVKNRAETDAFFMRVLGWNEVGANAQATAFMGIAVDSGVGIPVMPVGFFTYTENINNLVLGQEYTLISSDITPTIGSGNWGYIDFNEDASSNVIEAWLECGFNPEVESDEMWEDWTQAQNCPRQRIVHRAKGPTHHFRCVDHPDCLIPEDFHTPVNYLKWGIGDEGWWLAGQSGTRNSNCQDLQDLVDNILGRTFLVPMFDNWIEDVGGGHARFHLAAVGAFRITDAEVECTPSGNENPHWEINGVFETYYLPGGTGRHGDLRHTSGHTVFLDN